jgi:hypothetical protein
MEPVGEGTKVTAVECTGRALSALEEARGRLEEAAEYLSKVEGMAAERQKLQRLRKLVYRAFFLVDERRRRLRREGALKLQEAGAVVPCR